MNQFTEQYPDIRLTLIASNEPDHLRSADVDVCVLYGHGNWTDCWIRLWTTLKLFPVASPTLLNMRPLRSVRDLRNHVLLHGDDGREWNTWLAAADATEHARGAQHFMSDARLSTEAALYGQGVALGDTITASNLIAKGELIVPFDLTVPANNAFYVACRNEVRNAPIVKVFIDWLFASLETDTITEPQTSARRIIRPTQRQGQRSGTSRHTTLHPDDTPKTARSLAETPGQDRYPIGLLPMTAALLNSLVTRLSPPPIPAVQAWGKSYGGGHGPLIDLSQAVPGYPPHPDMLRWLGEAASSLAYTNYGPIEGETPLREAYAAHVSDLYGHEDWRWQYPHHFRLQPGVHLRGHGGCGSG